MTMTREEFVRDHDSGARERERKKERRIRGTGGVSDRRMRAAAFETRRAFSPAARVGPASGARSLAWCVRVERIALTRDADTERETVRV